jgi:hypothetical protein
MKQLPKILLATTFFTTTPFATEMVETTSADDTTASTHTTSIASHVQAKLDALNELISRTNTFNVSDAATLYFSPELYPLISWRSEVKSETVLSALTEIFIRSVPNIESRNHKILCFLHLAITSNNDLESAKAGGYHESEGIKNPTFLNEFVDFTLLCGQHENALEHFHLTFTPLMCLQIYLELLHQTNITPDSLGHVLRATSQLIDMKRESSADSQHKEFFTAEVLDLFPAILKRIATHPQTRGSDKRSAAGLLGQLNAG